MYSFATFFLGCRWETGLTRTVVDYDYDDGFECEFRLSFIVLFLCDLICAMNFAEIHDAGHWTTLEMCEL